MTQFRGDDVDVGAFDARKDVGGKRGQVRLKQGQIAKSWSRDVLVMFGDSGEDVFQPEVPEVVRAVQHVDLGRRQLVARAWMDDGGGWTGMDQTQPGNN